MPAPSAYFDASVLVKRYFTGPGSTSSRMLLRRYDVLSSAVVPVELVSELARRRSAGEVGEDDAIHVASALVLADEFGRRVPFLTADARQRAAAAAVNLEVVWVE